MRLLATAAAAVSLVLAVGGTTLAAQAAPAPDPDAGSYIVVLHDDAAAGQVAAAQSQRLGFDVGHVYRYALKGYSATMTPAVADLVAASPSVKWVQKDRPVHADAQTTPTGINRADADLSPTANINGSDERVNVDVAVIDTGVDLTHPDLNVYRAGAKNCSTLALSANDGHGHARTCPAPSARSTTAPVSWAWRRALGSGRSRCSPTSAAG
jgi:hypothetical protein